MNSINNSKSIIYEPFSLDDNETLELTSTIEVKNIEDIFLEILSLQNKFESIEIKALNKKDGLYQFELQAKNLLFIPSSYDEIL